MVPDLPYQVNFTSEGTVRGVVGKVLQGTPWIYIRDVWGNLVDGTYQVTMQGIAASCSDTICPSRGRLESTESNCSQGSHESYVCELGSVPASWPLDTLLFLRSGLYRLRVRVFDEELGVDVRADSLITPIAPKLRLEVQDINDAVAGKKLTHGQGNVGVNIQMVLSEESDDVVTSASLIPLKLTPVALSTPPTPARRSGPAVLVSDSEIYAPGGRPCMVKDTFVISSSGQCHLGEAIGPTCEDGGAEMCSNIGLSACLDCHADERMRHVLEDIISIPYFCEQTFHTASFSTSSTCLVPFHVAGQPYYLKRNSTANPMSVTICKGGNGSSSSSLWCGDDPRYVQLMQGQAIMGASIVNVGTYQLKAFTANFSDRNAGSRTENIFFQDLLDYTWASGLSSSFNVTPGEASGLEKLIDPGDCVLEKIGEAFCQISTAPVVRLISMEMELETWR